MGKWFHYMKLLIWKFFPISRPANLIVKGRFLINFNTKLSIPRNSKILIDGDADFTDSIIIFFQSNLHCKSIICNTSKIEATNSTIEFQDFLNFRNSQLVINSATISGKNHFRVHNYIMKLNSSLLKFESYFMFDGESCPTPTVEIADGNFTGGENSRIQATMLINKSDFKIGSNSFINSGTKINCQIGVEIGNYVMISYECIILDNNSHSINFNERRHEIDAGFPNGIKLDEKSSIEKSKITIEDDVWIGLKSMVFKGVNIGAMSIIAAGSVISKTVEKSTLVYGNANISKAI